MKHWLAQFTISEALRRRTALSRAWRARIDGDPQLGDFEHDARRLDRRLRNGARGWPARAPEDLAPAVFRAIRQTAPLAFPSQPAAAARWWIPVAACALLVITVAWWYRAPAPDQALNPTTLPPASPIVAEGTASEVLSAGTLLAGMGLYPSGSTADPLAAQLEAASQDARAAARFLVASLP